MAKKSACFQQHSPDSARSLIGAEIRKRGKHLFSDRSMIKWPRTDLGLLEVLLFRAGHSSTLLLLSTSFVILMQRAPIFPPALIPLT